MSLINHLWQKVNIDVKYLKAVVDWGDSATLRRQLSVPLGVSDQFEILVFSDDNFQPLK